MSRVAVLPDLDPASYARHPLHAEGRVWVEKNCYADIWIELLHALRLDPAAMLPFTVAVDFVGDQWTFFKPPHEDLAALYGVEVQELTVWRPLLDHAVEHAASGRFLSTEADAFWLPDTAGTDYRRQHTKTTIVLNDVDVDARRLGYFHNAGYHALEGEDFTQLFRLDASFDAAFMPLYAELVRVDRAAPRPPRELAALSRALLCKHLARRPADNPVRRFGARFAADLPELSRRGLDHYHAWAFATVRQLGAAFELAALHLRWLEAAGDVGLGPAADAFDAVSAGAKAFILKAARAVNARRPLDATATFADMAAAWDAGMATLVARLTA
jgi:hypothetical protein